MVLTQWETLCGLFFAFFEKIVVPILTSGGDVGVLRTGQAVHEVREQGAGAGKKYVKHLHRRCFSMLAAHGRGSDWPSIS